MVSRVGYSLSVLNSKQTFAPGSLKGEIQSLGVVQHGAGSLHGNLSANPSASPNRYYSTGFAEVFGSRPSVAFLKRRPLMQNSESAISLCST